MKIIEEKIKLINKTQNIINQLEKVLNLLEKSQNETWKSNKINWLNKITFTTEICTWTASPTFKEDLFLDKELNNLIALNTIKLINEQINKHILELNELIK